VTITSKGAVYSPKSIGCSLNPHKNFVSVEPLSRAWAQVLANRIPLYELHKSFGASFGVFAGWEAPINYASVLEEHVAVRKNVGIFDLSHMGRLVVEGLDAFKLLDKLVPRVIESEKGVMVGPTAFLNEQAGIKDDVMLYNLGDRWLVVTNAINRDKIRE